MIVVDDRFRKYYYKLVLKYYAYYKMSIEIGRKNVFLYFIFIKLDLREQNYNLTLIDDRRID